MKQFTTIKDFFHYINYFEGDVVIKGMKAYHNNQIIAICNMSNM